ncbi:MULTISPECIES: LPS export ABC transporter periplasmic protein LptC [unclassified Rhizobium]|uniref:LPS export ABC transporter periplasmic protein LptC n=1 Tax=unclassified Rhizobium TaxID=2613769 RepID=UPI0016152CE9|nr:MULTISPECIES: LPS export ABC transporter periplasmic protein LptC [unclassified Rhizobium]MBB3287413.1 lipopolysaccharide export system protein LptC [Rhizobium sp. BK252]MBB3402153.1 lipopolysaccharide export system protein LptC [Rhizobium sp. BK289]MBB3414730.1 lipopolysaccharide export system protein LptC [Rhizobium sp. BK284]MBB3482619.1 lipopolysaccharide export system protein LptC [Rhizobium sp. BK347]MDK4721696.1 LPS export ABC transporter periplasmic protein LptC [Rhizobium sp. CNPSo
MLNTIETPGEAIRPLSERNAYKDAIFHSARVKRLRVMLPLAALIVSLIFIAVSLIRAYLPADIQIEGAKIEDGKVVMERPAIAGRNKDGISYSLLAEKALQDLKNPNMITLKAIKASMPVNTDVIAHVTAQSADFDRQADTLKLTEPFIVQMDNGLRAAFKTAFLDVKKGDLSSQDEVAINRGGMSVVARSLKMTDKGSVIEFDGQVRMHIEPSALHNSASEQKPGGS